MSSNIRVGRVCMHCGVDFVARTTVTQYCSDKCSKAAYKARVRNKKVEKSETETHSIKTAGIDQIKSKEFLTVPDVAKLINCSRRTTYRLILDGTIPAIRLSDRKITIKRSDLDKVFENPIRLEEAESKPTLEIPTYEIEECYDLRDVEKIYGISNKALYELIKRNKIPKIKKGWYAYVPKVFIDKFLNVKHI